MIKRTFCRVGQTVRFTGNSYDFGDRISAMEFSMDDGNTWATYETPETNDYQTLTWSFDFTPDREGHYVLKVRSVNSEGKRSPEDDFAELTVECNLLQE